jgi:hypothetical protein
LGEPDNAEDVQLAVHDDHVGVTFRGNRWHARFPGEPISWFPEAQGRPR